MILYFLRNGNEKGYFDYIFISGRWDDEERGKKNQSIFY